MNLDTTETVATYDDSGRTFQIDHLGICYPSQAGSFAVYENGVQVAEFAPDVAWDASTVDESTALPSDIDMAELVAAAKLAVVDAESEEG